MIQEYYLERFHLTFVLSGSDFVLKILDPNILPLKLFKISMVATYNARVGKSLGDSCLPLTLFLRIKKRESKTGCHKTS